MRIAFFVQYCHEAGTYFRWHNLAKALVLLGNEVDIYAGDFNYKAKKRIEQRDGVRYLITPSLITCRIFGNPSDPFTALYRVVQKSYGKYDVYHLFQPFLQAYLPWRFKKYFSKGLFCYDWDDLWTGGIFKKITNLRENYVFWLVKKLESSIPKQANATSICSSFLQKKLANIKHSIILPNGFWPASKNQYNKQLNLFIKANNHFYIGYIGKTAAELDWIIEAANLLKDKKIVFIIAGPNKQQVEKSGLLIMPNMKYLGEVTPEEAKTLTSDLDLALLPLEDTSFNQSRFPIKFFDYLNAGTPVFYSGVGELKSIAANTSFVYEGGSTKTEWIKNLINLLDDIINQPKPLIDISQLEDTYSWKAIASLLLKYYQQHSQKNYA